MSDLLKATIIRDPSTEEGTFGTFSCLTFHCYSGELPWRDNKTGKSCIPAGTYKVVWTKTPKHGECYQLENVKDRTAILVHKGNWCGDVDRGWKSDVEGCLLLGNAIGTLVGQKALLSSKDAIARLVEHFDKEPWELTIKWKEKPPSVSS
jgi:hypothetical protein